MREILISFGILALCCGVLLIAQLTGTSPDAIAATFSSPAEPTETVQLAQSAADLIPANVPGEEASSMTEENLSPTPEENLTTTSSGLQYIDLVEGTGAMPQTGQRVTVHYTGTLENGTTFDSSRDRGRPFQFNIGVGQVIKGWDEGVGTMRVGGQRKLVVPPELGYGARGAGGVIPPNSTLIFDVELLSLG
ncbi:MAG: FKBP-type peptidyl-prolyl cis-trans isomerase [Cyanobacteria bacterium Co-bin8]|nr:FKBP-type peptidyl-prolyl cis-trans isomerase [Cyanobacteria bacterium Co-bin8]